MKMLVRFVVSNYLSFGEETEFNMLTGAPRRFKEHVYQYGDLELLKTAAIYGPNGAGKSNLVKAIALLKNVVTGDDGVDQYSFEPFRLKPSMENEPTHLEAEFIAEGIVYSYGIEIFRQKITQEWLYRTGKIKEELVFKRHPVQGSSTIEVGNNLIQSEKDKLRFELYEEELLPETRTLLNMMAGAKRVFSDVKNAFNWFKEGLTIITPDAKASWLPVQYFYEPKFKHYIDDFIATMRTGIERLELISVDFDKYFGEDERERKEKIKNQLKEDGGFTIIKEDNSSHFAFAVWEEGKVIVKRLASIHNRNDAMPIRFEINEESDGTQRILDFAPAFFNIVFFEKTILIDEIDQSIHPYLLKELVAKFVNDPNTKGQLIFTTHESNLLDQEIFRQDEIWFAEKKLSGETTFYPLSDYDIRYDLDIRKGYLNGRFGAIPFLGNLKDLKWGKYAEAEPVI